MSEHGGDKIEVVERHLAQEQAWRFQDAFHGVELREAVESACPARFCETRLNIRLVSSDTAWGITHCHEVRGVLTGQANHHGQEVAVLSYGQGNVGHRRGLHIQLHRITDSQVKIWRTMNGWRGMR